MSPSRPPLQNNPLPSKLNARSATVALIATTGFGACLAFMPLAHAESLATSASSAGSTASSAGSASLRGSSDSLGGSSDSSGGDAKVSEGDYRVTDIATIAGDDGKPPMLRLALAPVATHNAKTAPFAAPFTLDLPPRALEATPLVTGDLVRARHRPYGLAFSRGADDQTFFLVLADAWTKELQTRVVGN